MRSKFKWIFTLLVAFTMQFSFAQDKTVTGVVSDELGPIVGANVLVQGTTRGTTTDFDGKYTIKAKQGEVLVISYTGKKTMTVAIGAASSYDVSLKDDVVEGKVVEIVGAMGIKRTKDQVVSAQKQIGAAELTQASNPNAVQSLTGKVSGLQISTVSNGVTPTTRIVLRGNRSVSGDNQALVVIDNAISSATVLGQLPPDVIESVNVIKGAQGAALYGSQGVNGVIIVTTKRGSKEEKFTFGVTSSIDFESVNFVPERQTQYGQGWATDPGFDDGSGLIATFVPWENGSWGPAFNDPNMPAIVPVGLPQADGNFLFTEWKPIKDNIKQFFQTGTIMQNGFNFSVGGEDSYAFLSANRQNTDFVVDGDMLVRNSFLFRAGKKVGKFKIDGNVNYITQRASQTDSNLFDDLIQTASNVPVSRFRNSGNEGHWTVYAQNPYWITKAKRNDSRSDFMNGIAALNYEFNKNFNVSYTANIQMRNTEGQSHEDAFNNIFQEFSIAPYTYYGSDVETIEALAGASAATPSSYFASQSTSRNFYGDLLFNFNYDLTKDLNLKFNIGNNIQDRMSRTTSQGGLNLEIPGFYHISNVLNPSNPSTLDNRYTRSRIVAGFANFDFDYKGYLFLNVTGRAEQYSTVADPYFYPSVGLSFIPTKAFDIKGKVLNYMKLNASYTSVGNASAVAAYATDVIGVTPAGFPYGNLSAYGYNASPTAPGIKPEYVNTLEVGAQFGFFNDRVTLEASVYKADTKDLISNATASSASGNASLRDNIGDLENKGFEIDLGLIPVKTQNFKWTVNSNFAAYKTKITALRGGATSINLLSGASVGIFAEVGEEFPLIKGTKFVRDDFGNIIVNANGTPQRTSTFEKLGKGVPDYIVGLTNSFEFKGFKLTAVADYRNGASTYSEARNLLLFTGGAVDTAGFDRTNGYVVPNSVVFDPVTSTYVPNTTPAFTPDTAGVLNYFTTNYRAVGESSVIDAAALKIRELSLSYSLPKKLIENTGLTSMRFGINARNPFVFLADGSLLKAKNGIENRGYVDPEASITGGNAQGYSNIGQYPTTRTFGASLNLTF
ncbi:SusC/RagA family TonB-linked outer membrane protein [Flavobacterium proteolyticum]|uniref:SusC/RagA family TonB-linked outer membrane protein n=1 Tax=Flavobacterium proteolyticum TaxID=2911683 RepID=A0ABR9WN03_9FLAO|nr:SusC/RagA family TonB-linked outer membrane protein [Flavobacterium proteolyticum]MBE9575175.1 SusC/RagA family TonB-linked outer membrane protein [Flavobacterium proteolyticum]